MQRGAGGKLLPSVVRSWFLASWPFAYSVPAVAKGSNQCRDPDTGTSNTRYLAMAPLLTTVTLRDDGIITGDGTTCVRNADDGTSCRKTTSDEEVFIRTTENTGKSCMTARRIARSEMTARGATSSETIR